MSEEQTIEELKEVDPSFEPIYDRCNVCGRELIYVYEDRLSMCQICAGD